MIRPGLHGEHLAELAPQQICATCGAYNAEEG